MRNTMNNSLLKIAKNLDICNLKFDMRNGLMNSVPFVTRRPNGILLKKSISIKPSDKDYNDYDPEISGKILCITNYININKDIIAQANKNDQKNIAFLTGRYFASNSVNQELFDYIKKNTKTVELIFKNLFKISRLILLQNEKEGNLKENLMNKFPHVKPIKILQKEISHSFKSLGATVDYPSIFIEKDIIATHEVDNFFNAIFKRALLVSFNNAQLQLVKEKEFELVSEPLIKKFDGFDYVGVGFYLSFLNTIQPNPNFNDSFFKLHQKYMLEYSTNISTLINETLLKDIKSNNPALFKKANDNIIKNIHKHFSQSFGLNYLDIFNELDNELKTKSYTNGKRMTSPVNFS